MRIYWINSGRLYSCQKSLRRLRKKWSWRSSSERPVGMSRWPRQWITWVDIAWLWIWLVLRLSRRRERPPDRGTWARRLIRRRRSVVSSLPRSWPILMMCSWFVVLTGSWFRNNRLPIYSSMCVIVAWVAWTCISKHRILLPVYYL